MFARFNPTKMAVMYTKRYGSGFLLPSDFLWPIYFWLFVTWPRSVQFHRLTVDLEQQSLIFENFRQAILPIQYFSYKLP